MLTSAVIRDSVQCSNSSLEPCSLNQALPGEPREHWDTPKCTYITCKQRKLDLRGEDVPCFSSLGSGLCREQHSAPNSVSGSETSQSAPSKPLLMGSADKCISCLLPSTCSLPFGCRRPSFHREGKDLFIPGEVREMALGDPLMFQGSVMAQPRMLLPTEAKPSMGARHGYPDPRSLK